VVGQQNALDVLGMVDDVVVNAAGGRKYPINVAESGEVVLQARQ